MRQPVVWMRVRLPLPAASRPAPGVAVRPRAAATRRHRGTAAGTIAAAGTVVLLWTAAAGAASAPTAPGLSPDDPRAWLERTDEALATRNYRGVFVHEYAGETETLRIVHRVGSDGLSERLQSLDGSGREFIRRGNELYCYLPDQHTVLVERSSDQGLLLAGLPHIDATPAGQYQVRQVARTRVSGRIARVIAIEPRDQLRYGYRVWIDEATAMPLRMQLRSARGRVLEQIVFTELALPAHIAASELAPGIDARHFRWVQQNASAAAAPNVPGLSVTWQASALPAGFRMTASAQQMLPGGPAEHLVFSDGLASVSVFVQPRQERNGSVPRDDSASLGTSSAYAVALQGYRVTVVGEVPPQTVREIAQAFRSAGQASGLGEPGVAVPMALSPEVPAGAAFTEGLPGLLPAVPARESGAAAAGGLPGPRRR